MEGWGKIAIGTRMDNSCDPLFFNCWDRMLTSGLRSGDTCLDAAIELPQHFAATVLVRYFLRSDADTLLMVDNDMIFAADTLARLRDDKAGWDYDVLGALTVARRRPFVPVLFRWRENPKDGETAYICIKDGIDGGIMDVDTVGLCFTLIRRSVFEKMKSELEIDRWFIEWGNGGLGEDTQFCQRAQSVGLRLGVHTGISIGHRGRITFLWNQEKQQTEMETYNQVKDLFL